MHSLSVARVTGQCGDIAKTVSVGRHAKKNRRLAVVTNSTGGASKFGKADVGVEQQLGVAQPLGLIAKDDSNTVRTDSNEVCVYRMVSE